MGPITISPPTQHFATEAETLYTQLGVDAPSKILESSPKRFLFSEGPTCQRKKLKKSTAKHLMGPRHGKLCRIERVATTNYPDEEGLPSIQRDFSPTSDNKFSSPPEQDHIRATSADSSSLQHDSPNNTNKHTSSEEHEHKHIHPLENYPFAPHESSTEGQDKASAPAPIEGDEATGGLCPPSSYSVHPEHVDMLHTIFNKHGDIASQCMFSTNMLRSTLLDGICKTVVELNATKLSDLRDPQFDAWVGLLRDAELAKIDIKWLSTRLNEISEARELFTRYKDTENTKKGHEETILNTKAALEQKRKAASQLKTDIEATEKRLRSYKLMFDSLSCRISNLEATLASCTSEMSKAELSLQSLEAQCGWFRDKTLGDELF